MTQKRDLTSLMCEINSKIASQIRYSLISTDSSFGIQSMKFFCSEVERMFKLFFDAFFNENPDQ